MFAMQYTVQPPPANTNCAALTCKVCECAQIRQIRQSVQSVACNSKHFQSHHVFHEGGHTANLVIRQVELGEGRQVVQALYGADTVVCQVEFAERFQGGQVLYARNGVAAEVDVAQPNTSRQAFNNL